MTTELSAHKHRVAELISRMPANSRFREICESLDEAVEFAACEGVSIAEAVAEFFGDDTGPGKAELRAIAFAGGAGAGVPPGQLPVLPKAASRLLKTSDTETSAAELERIAASDPVFASRLLGAANSARYGSRFAITRIGEAILRLGVPATRQVLLASCLAGLFGSKSLRNLWEHSQEVAEMAHSLAGFVGVAPETAYAAGLLHDIGRLVFQSGPASLSIAEQSWLAAGFPLLYAETLVYGRDHAMAGGELLRAWGVPNEIADAVEFHHRPGRTEGSLHSILYLAEAPEDLWTNMLRVSACGKTGIRPEQLDSVTRGEGVRGVREIACA